MRIVDKYLDIDFIDFLFKFPVDSGMIVVIFICLGYLLLVIGLLFFVKNDWCDLLFRNMTVHRILCFFSSGPVDKFNN